MARTKRPKQKFMSGYEPTDQMAFNLTKLSKHYSVEVEMPVHGNNQYYTELYDHDEDQVSSYPT